MKLPPLTLALAVGVAYLISRPSKASTKSTPSFPIKLTQTSIEVIDPIKAEQFYIDKAREYLTKTGNDLTKIKYIPLVTSYIQSNPKLLYVFMKNGPMIPYADLTDAQRLIAAHLVGKAKGAIESVYFGGEIPNEEDQEAKLMFEQWQNVIHPKIFDEFNKFILWDGSLQNQLIDVNKAIEQYNKWPL